MGSPTVAAAPLRSSRRALPNERSVALRTRLVHALHVRMQPVALGRRARDLVSLRCSRQDSMIRHGLARARARVQCRPRAEQNADPPVEVEAELLRFMPQLLRGRRLFAEPALPPAQLRPHSEANQQQCSPGSLVPQSTIVRQ